VEADPFRTRDHVSDFDAIVSDIVGRSATARAELRMEANLRYGEGPSEALDLFFPEGNATNLPVHIFIHGGYWRMFSKDDYSLVANSVTKAGAIAVVIGYALMPGVRMATIVDQVRRAKAWVIDNIARYGGDPTRLSVSGHSAGAQLASLLFSADQAPSSVSAALLLGGLYDLKPLQKSFLKQEIALTDEEVANWSPLRHDFDRATEVSILVGARETPPFHQQANAFAQRLHKQGSKVSQKIIVTRNHMNSARDLGDPTSLTGRCLIEVVRAASGAR
jgi:arylformamidase